MLSGMAQDTYQGSYCLIRHDKTQEKRERERERWKRGGVVMGKQCDVEDSYFDIVEYTHAHIVHIFHGIRETGKQEIRKECVPYKDGIKL